MNRVFFNPRSPLDEKVKNRREFLQSLGIVAGFFLLPKPLRARSLAAPVVTINVLRPPGAVMEQDYPGKCIRCGRCAEVCPYRCIKLLDIRAGLNAGTPVVFAEESPCYLCMKCVHVCPTGALTPIEQSQTRMGLAVIDRHSCVSWNKSGLLCKTCYNVCPFIDKAIRMVEFRPHVDEKHCTGCGICTRACLVARSQGGKAINIHPIYSTIKLPEVSA